MFSYIKQRLLIFLEEKGWRRHPKERNEFHGYPILATKGAFFRAHEKDDAWLFALSRHYHNIMDVGCNIGQSSMLMLIGTENKMICVDPNPKALSVCAENLIFNNLSTRVSFVNAFVGCEEGKEIEFFTIGTGAAGSMFSGFAKTATQHQQSIFVKTRTLESICQQSGFVPDFIKIDVEGAEQLVLQGIGNSLLAVKPVIFVEMHSGDGLRITDNTQALLDWCKLNNYSAWYMKKHIRLTEVGLVADRGRYHALLLPNGVPYPEYLTLIPENSPVSFVPESKK